MLELLVKYAEEHDLVVEPGFAPKSARWALLFSPDGDFLGVIELGDTASRRNSGQRFQRAPELSFSELRGGSETKSHFLIESADVVACFAGGRELPPKTRAKHVYFVRLLREASSSVPVLGAIARALSDQSTLGGIQEQLVERKAKPADKVTIAVQGHDPTFIVDDPAWHDWWRRFRSSLAPPARATRGVAEKMRCLASGELASPTRVAPKIKGLADVGGLATGDALVSFKQESFCSYGLAQATNAPVSEHASLAYRAALNHLIEATGRRFVGAKVVHWFRERVPPEDDPVALLEEPPEDAERDAQRRARELIEAICTGTRPDLAGNHYYALTLCGAAGRVVLRDWMEGPFEALLSSVHDWFDHFAIARRDGSGLTSPPKFLAVLGALVRDLKELPAPLEARMWRAAIRNEPIPLQALAAALNRARVAVLNDDPPNHAGMGILKAYHVRKGDEHMTAYLNEEHPSTAYQCGRLLAVLADLQRSAQGDVGAGIVQRFYAAASATPALVLGRLTTLSKHHLGKLEPGLANWYERLLADIWGRIKDEVPRTLTLEEQSLFALGYYHQKAAPKKDQAS